MIVGEIECSRKGFRMPLLLLASDDVMVTVESAGSEAIQSDLLFCAKAIGSPPGSSLDTRASQVSLRPRPQRLGKAGPLCRFQRRLLPLLSSSYHLPKVVPFLILPHIYIHI